MRLSTVYAPNLAQWTENVQFLYDLLAERDPIANISHREMPTPEQHLNFVKSMPYWVWYLIEECTTHEWFPVGSIYLTRQDEIGLQLKRDWVFGGRGRAAIDQLMVLNPRSRYLANIAFTNPASQEFFKRLGFTPIQVTYELRRSDTQPKPSIRSDQPPGA